MLLTSFRPRPLAQRILIMYAISLAIILGIATVVASLTVKNSLQDLVVKQQSEKLHAVEKALLNLGDLRLADGKMYAGDAVLNDNFEFVDDMKRRTNNEITIFANDTRITTTVEKDGKRLVGTKLTGPAKEAAIDKHTEYHGPAMVVGIPFLGSYLFCSCCSPPISFIRR